MIVKFKLFLILENNSYFSELYQKYFNKMKWQVCSKYFPDKDDAYDVCTDAFMNRILPHLDRVKSASTEEGYIRMIVRNSCIDKIRSLKSQRELVQKDYISQTYDEPVQDWFSKVNPKKLQAAIQKLPPAYKKAIEMYYMKDMTHDEIAKELGITASTSKTNLMKGKIKLREILEPEKKLALQEKKKI